MPAKVRRKNETTKKNPWAVRLRDCIGDIRLVSQRLVYRVAND